MAAMVVVFTLLVVFGIIIYLIKNCNWGCAA